MIRHPLILLALLPALSALADSNGPPDGYAGHPPDNHTCIECHDSYALNEGIGGVGFLQFIGNYQPGNEHYLVVATGHTGFDRWGMQMTVLDTANQSAGILLPAPDGDLVLSNNPVPEPDFLGQNTVGMYDGEPFGAWTVRYIAPPPGTGPITFYLTGVAADGDGTPAGDYVYTSTQGTNEGNGGSSEPVAYTLTEEHEFGWVPLGTSRSFSTTLYNIGGGVLEVLDLPWAIGDWFSLDAPTGGPYSLPAGGSLEITVSFTPGVSGSWGDTLQLVHPGGVNDSLLYVHGRGTDPLPPEPFDLISPEDGAVVGGDSVRFAWTPTVNLDSTDTRPGFTLQIDTESDFPTPAEYDAGRDTSFTVPRDSLTHAELYFWRVHARDSNTPGTFSTQQWAFLTDFVGVPDNDEAGTPPGSPLLLDSYPNPFNAGVTVTFAHAQPGEVRLEVVSVTGRRVAVLHAGRLPAGSTRFHWNAGRAAAGVYLLRAVRAGSPVETRKLVLLR